MAIALEVSWAQRSPHPLLNEQITHIGGSSGSIVWSHSSKQAIESIESNLFSYYIVKDSRAIGLEIGRTLNGEKYLKIRSNEDVSTLLFNLPAFPEISSAA